jgi:hypothetical protein
MIEITNKTKGPVQLCIRTKVGKGLTVKNIPGIGAGNNVYLLEDERHTDYVDRAEKLGLITQRKISTKAIKGDK